MSQTIKTVLFLLTLALCGVALVALASAPPKPPELTAVDDVPVVTGDWKLPPGHFVLAKMPMRQVYPRPDNETASWARHRKAYPGLEYRIPVAIQGGAYPFRFQVISGPEGMTIGSTVWEPDYAIVTWTPAESGGPYPVKILVTDQEYNEVTVEFDVRATTEGFIFLDPSVASSGTGTIDSPLKTFDDLHLGSRHDRTFSGKILYLRGGTHQLSGTADSNGNFRIPQDNKPLVWLGYPGENPVIDASRAVINMIDSASGRDAFFSGFALHNSRSDVGNSRFFFFGGGSGHRSTFFELDFKNLVRGTAGDDNPGAIVKFAGGYAENFVVINSSIEDYQAPLVGSMYDTRYAVIEGNRLGSSSIGVSPQGIFPKANSDFWSVRRNVSKLQPFREGAVQQFMGGSDPQRVEIAYNLLVHPSASGRPLLYNWSGVKVGYINTTWVYRNTVLGDLAGLDAEYNAVFENNVILNDSDGGFLWISMRPSVNYTLLDNLIGRRADESTILDEHYRLTGSYRDSFLGRRGHEIAH